MGDRRSSAAGPLGALAISFACIALASAEGSQLIATVERPAVVTAAVPGLGGSPDDQRVVVSVMAYTPPRDGTVQGVVKAQRSDGGPEHELGRFGLFPNAEFRAADPSQAQRFSFPLPKDLASGGPVQLKVQLVPSKGEGKDARLEVGGAEIR
jgi:hypothetical protein